MPSLEKAKLYEITAAETPTVVSGPTDVQFNPESLKVQLKNRIEGGRSAGRQARQFVGASSNTFTLELEFDTADEGSTESPVSVLERTQVLDPYIQPRTEGDNAAEQPSRLRFHWGNLIIDGIVENIDMEFDHFAHNGYPLHARATLTMKEQKVEFVLREQDASAASDRSAAALEGELPAQAAARLGLDPAGWRGLDLGLESGLSLEAGVELGFSAGFSASLGLEVKAGFEADIDADLSAKLGLEVDAGFQGAAHLADDPRPRAQVGAGVALAGAGGIVAATESVNIAHGRDAANHAAVAFGITSAAASTQGAPTGGQGSTANRPAGPGQPGPATRPSERSMRPSDRPRPDARVMSFGRGVPLKDRRTISNATSIGSTHLLPASPGRALADRVQNRRRPVKRCGCSGRCHHRS